MSKRCLLVLVALVAATWLLTAPAPADDVTTRISVGPSGEQIGLPSWSPSMSADGRFVAFQSLAETVVPTDTNWVYDIYVYDRIFGRDNIASLSNVGALGDRESLYPAMSADGSCVAFVTTATNLTPESAHANGVAQVYVHTMETCTTELVSVSTSGELANGPCARPSLSADGRYVVFASQATNLIPNGPAMWAIYLRDRVNRTTECLSLSSTGELPTAVSIGPAITPDGRYVAFYSYAGNLVPGDANLSSDVFLRDRQAGTIEIVSLTDQTGQPAHGDSYGPRPALTPDGRYVVFSSKADNLVPNDTNGTWDVFVRDRVLGTTERVSVSSGGEQGNAQSGYDSGSLAISSDGRYVTFASLAGNLVPDDTNGAWDVFVRDRVLGTTARASVSAIGGIGNGDSGYSGLSASADGAAVVFDSKASDLVAGDTNNWLDVFLRAPSQLPDLPALVIQGGATFTNRPGVTLTIAPGSCTQLRFRDDAGDWTAWEPSAATRAWVLPDGDGLKKVVAQGQYADLTLSPEFSDAILLDTVAPTAPAIAINDGADATNNPKVILALESADAAQVRLRNESDDWSEWKPFTPRKAWLLSPGDGVKAVYAQVRDAAGNDSPEASDEILLNPSTPSGPSVSIDDGAALTNSKDVTLTLLSNGAVEMRFRNESHDWSDWEPYATTKAWTLSQGDGTKVVYFQTRDAQQVESIETWDDIVLDTVPPRGVQISVNGGAASTYSHRVTLTLAATGAVDMHLRNESGDWSAWEPFAASKAWTLSAASGTKTVGFEARDAAGNVSDEVTDTIQLKDFGDIDSTFWAYREIRACVDAGIVAGYPDGTYQPSTVVTRDQMAVFISRAVAGGETLVPSGPAQPSFPDVAADYWAFKYIEYAQAKKIVTGYPEGTYAPGDPVDRGQMAVFIARSVVNPTGDEGLTGYTPPTTASFPDVKTDFWAFKYVEFAKSRNIVGGYPDGTYRPADPVTRDQMAVYIARAFALPLP